MRKTPLSRPKKTDFEFHYGRKLTAEVKNMLKQKSSTVDSSTSAKPGTLQVYSIRKESSQTDLFIMKAIRKAEKRISRYPFYFLERNYQKNKFESPYYEEP